MKYALLIVIGLLITLSIVATVYRYNVQQDIPIDAKPVEAFSAKDIAQ